MLQIAEALARKWHEGQTYGNGTYYDNHLERVRNLVEHLGGSVEDQATALLHDILEDTNIPEAELQAAVSASVFQTVKTLTHRKHETYADYMDRVLADDRAVLVKFADSSANLQASLKEAELEQLKDGFISQRTARRIVRYKGNLSLITAIL